MNLSLYKEMLTLKVLTPLVLHRKRAGEQFAPTLDYIPGSTVRGAFAECYLRGDQERSQDELFKHLFLSDKVFFSDFFPAEGEGSHLTRLLPASAMACKRFDDHKKSLSDCLLWLEMLREWDAPSLEIYHRWKRCPDCMMDDLEGKRDPVDAGYYLSVERSDRLRVGKRMMANTAIERTTRTAAHGLLFSHEAIEESGVLEGQAVFFRGLILSAEDVGRKLKDLAPKAHKLLVGHGRSRGLGLLRVESWSNPAVEVQSLRERWQKLNNAIHRLWEQHQREPTGQYFSLTLQSHLALRNPAGQPVLGRISAADLGLPSQATRCRCLLRAESVSGWNAAQGLPKADTWALSRGSVLLFRLPHGADPAPVLDRLEALEEEGAGERRAEGLGRMIACDPFHYYFTDRELKGGL